MEFLPTVANTVPLWLTLIGMGGLGLIILSILVLTVSALIFKSPTELIAPLLIVGIFFMIVFAMVSGVTYVVNAQDHAKNFQSNLLRKYDIVSVDYESELSQLRITKTESQLITVNLKDDKKGNFLLTQNARTNEPTLSELPESEVSVAEITR